MTVDGFTVEGNTNANLDGAGVYIAPGTHGTIFQNNIVKDNIIGLYPANNLGTDPLNINHNRFTDNTNPGPASGADMYADNFTAGGPITGAVITANCFTNSSYNANGSAVILSNINGASPFSNITISSNTIDNTGLGVFLSATSNSSITGNTFTPNSADSASAAVYLCGGVSCLSDAAVKNTNISITQNEFGCASCASLYGGVAVNDVGATGIAVNRNDLHGLPVGIDNIGPTPTVDGTCNWWGAVSGPAAGQVVGAVAASTWLNSSLLSGPCGHAPGAPTIGPISSQGISSAVVSFTPGPDGGSPITGYTATCVSLAGQPTVAATGAGSPVTVTGLVGGTPYQCSVVETNAFGPSPPSGLSSVIWPVSGAPGEACTTGTLSAPTVLSTGPGPATAVVSWGPSVPTNCVAGYVVTPYVGGVAQLATVIPGHGTTTVIKGLVNGATYQFTVAAEDGHTEGPASTLSGPVIVGTPSAAAGVHVTRVAKGQLSVAFSAPRGNGAAITSYTATCVSSNHGTTRSRTGKKGPLTVTGLSAGKTYACTVKAANSRGTGPASQPSRAVKA